jgi:DNA recombination-dependent growth factor C
MDGKQESRIESAEITSVLAAGSLVAGLALYWREKLG